MNTETETDIRRGATSASNAQADLLCPGRHLAQKGIPESKSKDSDFGRAVHEALKTGDPSKLTHEQSDIYESCSQITQRLMASVFGPDASKVKVFKEQRYWCKVLGEVIIPADGSGPSPTREYKEKVFFTHSGQPDLVARHGPLGLIIEYKTLPGEVADSQSNQQLRDQLVLAGGALLLTEVHTAVVQPLVTHTPTVTLYNKDAIRRAVVEMHDRVRKSNDPRSPRVAGEVQCKFCRAKGICAEYAKWSSQVMPIISTDNPFLVAMQGWSVEQRSLVAAHLPRLRKLLDDTEDFLKALLVANPDSVPGFYLKDNPDRSSVNNPQELFNRFAEKGGTLEQFMGCINVTKGKFEAEVKAVTKTKGKALAAQVDALLEGIVTTVPVAKSLAKKKEEAK